MILCSVNIGYKFIGFFFLKLLKGNFIINTIFHIIYFKYFLFLFLEIILFLFQNKKYRYPLILIEEIIKIHVIINITA